VDLKAAWRTYNTWRRGAQGRRRAAVRVTGRGVRLLLALLAVRVRHARRAAALQGRRSRYAEIPREMVASGDWITPRLNGLKDISKAAAAVLDHRRLLYAVEVADWSARCGLRSPALQNFIGCFCRKASFRRPAGVYAAAVLAGSPLYVMRGRSIRWDMGLTFFLWRRVAFALGHMLLFWAACARAMLGKGLIGSCCVWATIASLYPDQARPALLGKMKIFSGGALFLAIAAPWFIAVSLANDEFCASSSSRSIFQRFTTEMHGRRIPPLFFSASWPPAWRLAADRSASRCFIQSKSKAEDSMRSVSCPVGTGGVWFFSASGEVALLHPADVPAARAADRPLVAAFDARRALVRSLCCLP